MKQNQNKQKKMAEVLGRKYSFKEKGAAMRASLSRTGGGLDDVKPLSELELKILDLLGENFLGLNNPECGVPVGVTVSLEPESCENSLDEPSKSKNTSSTSKPASISKTTPIEMIWNHHIRDRKWTSTINTGKPLKS
ncbi:uncharacterized protein isoform X2 [Leptinotarsa decemlineata]|uniref:uncharacterized protein isoform X2 n=1 Tax=Leptinotarsa decemlineata TaxID=7539 RepID=UPI003D309F06